MLIFLIITFFYVELIIINVIVFITFIVAVLSMTLQVVLYLKFTIVDIFKFMIDLLFYFIPECLSLTLLLYFKMLWHFYEKSWNIFICLKYLIIMFI